MTAGYELQSEKDSVDFGDYVSCPGFGSDALSDEDDYCECNDRERRGGAAWFFKIVSLHFFRLLVLLQSWSNAREIEKEATIGPPKRMTDVA